jgi:uroporphyrinogen decarboxylase
VDLDNLEFENPNNEARYQRMHSEIQLGQNMPHRPYIFLKIGGPFLRPSFLRGEFQWYIDIAEDPAFASTLSEVVVDHLIEVGTQALKRSALPETFLMIHDDIASNRGLLISPTAFGHLFLPQIQRMVTAFKKAGAVHVGYHSDGDIRDIVEGLIDVGISILNPIEPRANMDVLELKQRYGDKLAFIGGLCNSVILPTGSEDEVRQHVERVLFAGENGGLVIGSHSISNELTLDRYHLVMEILHQHGRPLPGET